MLFHKGTKKVKEQRNVEVSIDSTIKSISPDRANPTLTRYKNLESITHRYDACLLYTSDAADE